MDDDENLMVGVVLGGTLLFLTLVTIFILVTFCRSNRSAGVIFVCPPVDVHAPTSDDTMTSHRTSSNSDTRCPLMGSLCRLLSKNNARSTETTDVVSIATADANYRHSPSFENPRHVKYPPCGMSTSKPDMWSGAFRSPGHCVGLSSAKNLSDFVEDGVTFTNPSTRAGRNLQYRLAEDLKDLDATDASVESLKLEEAQEAGDFPQRVRESIKKGKSTGNSSNIVHDDSPSDDNKDVTSGEKITDTGQCSKVPVLDYRDLEIHVTDETRRGHLLLSSSVKSSCTFEPSICLHTTDTVLVQSDKRINQGCAFEKLTSTSRDHPNNNILSHKTSRFDKTSSEINASLKNYNRKNHPGDDVCKTSRWTFGYQHAQGLGVDNGVESTVKLAMSSARSYPNTKSFSYPNKISSGNHKGFTVCDQKSLVKRENVFKYSCHLNGNNPEDASLEERVQHDRKRELGHLCKTSFGGTDSRRIKARSDIDCLIRPGPFNAATLNKNRKIKPSTPGPKVKIIKEVCPPLNQNHVACGSFNATDIEGKFPDVNIIDFLSEEIQNVKKGGKRKRHVILDILDNKGQAIEKNRIMFPRGDKYNLTSKISHNSYDLTDDLRLYHRPLRVFQEMDTTINAIPYNANLSNRSEGNPSNVSPISGPRKELLSSSLVLDDKSFQPNDSDKGDTQTPNQKITNRQSGFPYSFPVLRGCKRSVSNSRLPMASLRFDDGFLEPHDKDEPDTPVV